MKRTASLSALAAALILGAAAAPAALAQEAADATFVVTASRVPEEVQAVPASVAVVTAQEIADSGASSVVEVLERVEGVSFRSYSNDAQAEVSMRGFGENSSGRVLLLVDGKRMNNPDMQTIDWLSIPLSDVERIEVLQGASSARYGNNAVGGVINVITKRPAKGSSVKAAASYGSFGEYRNQFSLNQGNDKGGVAANAEIYGSDGYRDRSGYRSATASVKGTYDATDALSLNAGVSIADIYYEMPGSLTKSQASSAPSSAANWADEARERNYSMNLGADWTPAKDLSVALPLFYSLKQIQVDMPSYYSAVYGTLESHNDRTVNTLQTSPTASWETSLGSLPLRLVGGADLSIAYLNVDQYSDKARTAKLNGFEIVQGTVGPFITARLTLPASLAFESGVRYDQATIAAKTDDGTVDETKLHQAVVYDAGLVFRPSKNAKVFVRYGTLFRYPFTDEQTSLYYSTYSASSFNKDLDPEQGFNLETGTSLAFGKLASLDATAYWMEMKDEIAYNSATAQNENLDKTKRLGADLSATLRPFSFLDLNATYGYVRAVFDAGTNKGNYVPLVPAQRLEARATIKAPAGVKVEPSVSYRSDAYQGSDNSNTMDKIAAYAVYDLGASWTPAACGGSLVFTVKAKNLLDKTYSPYVYYDAYYPAAGRSLNLGASYRF